MIEYFRLEWKFLFITARCTACVCHRIKASEIDILLIALARELILQILLSTFCSYSRWDFRWNNLEEWQLRWSLDRIIVASSFYRSSAAKFVLQLMISKNFDRNISFLWMMVSNNFHHRLHEHPKQSELVVWMFRLPAKIFKI